MSDDEEEFQFEIEVRGENTSPDVEESLFLRCCVRPAGDNPTCLVHVYDGGGHPSTGGGGKWISMELNRASLMRWCRAVIASNAAFEETSDAT